MNVQTIAATQRPPAIGHATRDRTGADFGAAWDRATGGEDPAPVETGIGDATAAARTIAAFDLALSPTDAAAASAYADGARQASIAQGCRVAATTSRASRRGR